MNGEITTSEGRYVNVLFHESMIKKIDKYRFNNWVASRTEAIRQLIERSLENEDKKVAKKAAMQSRVMRGKKTKAA